MRSKSLIRLEWISLVYLALFVLAVLSPSIVTHGYFGLDERHVEESLIFIFGIVGLGTFSIYQGIMERREKEHEDAKMDYERAKRELIESYSYIGSINRKMEVLKKMTADAAMSIVESEKRTKDLYAKIVASAAGAVGSSSAMLRFVHVDKRRTELEIHHAPDGNLVRMSNKELAKVHDAKASYAFLSNDDGKELLVVPSIRADRPIRAFLVIKTDPSVLASEIDTSLLGVFANQADLVRFAFSASAGGTEGDAPKEPLDLIRETEKWVQGEVS